MAISIYREEAFSVALVNAFTAATAIFLTWAFGREIDPAHQWSAFIALPLVFAALFVVGRPSLLVLLFLILCCRLLNRTSGRQPLKSDSILLLVMGVLLYFNNLYFALPYLAICFLIDALAKPGNSFQYISALVTAAAFPTLLLTAGPGIVLFIPGAMTTIYPVAGMIIVTLSAIFLSIKTRHVRVLDDLEQEELNCLRINAARLLAAAWIVSEIFFGGTALILQIYPPVLAFGGTFLYHLTVRCLKI